MRVSEETSVSFTISLVLITGFVGAALAKRQGLRTWQNIQEQTASGRVPGGALVDGLLILIAGAVLITPGILTDLFGFALLIPPVREILKAYLTKRFEARTVVQTSTSFHSATTQSSPSGPQIIDAEFTRHPSDS